MIRHWYNAQQALALILSEDSAVSSDTSDDSLDFTDSDNDDVELLRNESGENNLETEPIRATIS